MSLLLFWFPGLGLLFAVLAYCLNRRSHSWTSWGSKIALTAAVLVNVVLVVLLMAWR
jgi:hypothetical protein